MGEKAVDPASQLEENETNAEVSGDIGDDGEVEQEKKAATG